MSDLKSVFTGEVHPNRQKNMQAPCETVVVEGREVPISEHAAGDRVNPGAVHHRAPRNIVIALRHIILPRRADQKCGASLLADGKRSMELLVVRLHPEAIPEVSSQCRTMRRRFRLQS